jgi:hypothetical protein
VDGGSTELGHRLNLQCEGWEDSQGHAGKKFEAGITFKCPIDDQLKYAVKLF